MSKTTPKKIHPDDVILGVCLADRDIIIPYTARYLPIVRYASASLVIPMGLQLKSTEEAEVEFAIGVYAPLVPSLNIGKMLNADIGIGITMETSGSHSCVADADIPLNISADAIATHGHIVNAEFAHELSPNIVPSKGWVSGVEIGIGVSAGVRVATSESPTDTDFDINVGVDAEISKYRARMLADLEEATLADISTMTLQELYLTELQS